LIAAPWRSTVWIPVVIIALIVLCFATGTGTSGRPKTLYAHPPCPPELMDRYYVPILQRYLDGHPDFGYQHVATNYEQKTLTMVVGGLAPDVIFVYPHNFSLWVSKDVLTPLDDLIAADADIDYSQYAPRMLDVFKWDGRQYGLPKDGSVNMLYYNVELFDRYEVAYPSPDWTWDDFRAACEQLSNHRVEGGRTFGTSMPFWWELVWCWGGDVLDARQRRCLLDSVEAVAALQFLRDLMFQWHVSLRPTEREVLSDSELFASGRLGMFFGAYPHASILRETCAFEWDIALTPKGPAGRHMLAVPSAYGIWSGAKNKRAAFEFIKYITRDAMYDLLDVEAPSYLPAARSPEFLENDAIRPKHKGVALEAMDYARRLPATPHWLEIQQRIEAEIIQPICEDRQAVDVARVCRGGTRRVNAFLASLEGS